MKKIIAVFVLLLLVVVQLMVFEGGGYEEEEPIHPPTRGEAYILENASSISVGNDNIEFQLNKDVNCGISKIIDKETGLDLRGNKVPPPMMLMIMYWTGSSTDIVIQWDAESMDTNGVCVRDHALLYIYYHKFRGSNLNATVTMTLYDDAEFAEFTLDVENDEDFVINSVFFPLIWGLGQIGDSAKDDRVFYPGGDGIVLKDPLNYTEELFMTEMYPSTASMQMFCHYDPDEAGLFITTDDGQGYPKKPSLDFMEWSGEEHLAGFYEHPVVEYVGNDYNMDYSCRIGTFHGDWYDAADIYKSWAETTDFLSGGKVFEDKDTPDWWAKTSVVSSSNRDAEIIHNTLSKIENMTEEFNELTGINTTHLIFAWAQNGAWCGPYYFPPAAGEDNFTNSMENITEIGGHPFLYISGSVWRISRGDIGYEDFETFNEIGDQWVCIDKNGNPVIDAGYLILNWTSARMCPMTDFWHEMVVNNTLQCLELGADVVQIDEFPIGSIYPCHNASHGHPLGYSKDITAAYRSIINDSKREGRKINPNFIMSMEQPCEFYIPWMDTYVSRDNAPEFLIYPFALEQFGNDVEFVPFFSYVYHEYITAFAEPIPMNYDYPELFINQMKRSLARACVSGEIVSGSAQKKEELWPEVSQFYNTTVRASATYGNDYLIKGKPLRPPTIDVPDTTVDWFFYSTQTLGTPFDERSVLNSAWKSDNGDIGHVFINWIDSEIEFDVELPKYDLEDGNYSIIMTRNGVRETLLRRTELPLTIHLETNPSEVILIEITKLPDLAINDIGINMHGDQLMTNDTYHLETSIENTGIIGSGPFEVKVFFDGTMYRTWSFSSLDPWMDVPIELEWNTTGFLGEYNVTFVVDPDEEILELDENNNTAWGIVRIFDRPRSDLTVNVIENGTGRSIENATVELQNSASAFEIVMYSNETGVVQFDDLIAGKYVLNISHSDHFQRSLTIDLFEGEERSVEIDLQRMISLYNITINVFDNISGKPIFDANVTLHSTIDETYIFSRYTETEGVFVFTDIPKGTYTLWAEREKYHGQNEALVLDGSVIDLNFTFHLDQIPPGFGSIRCYLFDNETKEPLQSVYVQFGPVDLGVSLGGDGMFDLYELDSGLYTVEATKGGYTTWYGDITIEMGKTTIIEIYMDKAPYIEPPERFAGIKGNITNGTGGVIEEASIYIIGTPWNTTSDENGFFIFSELEAGTYHLRIDKEGYEPKDVTVTVNLDDMADLTIVLEEEEEEEDEGSDDPPPYALYAVIAVVGLGVILLPIIIFSRARIAADSEE